MNRFSMLRSTLFMAAAFAILLSGCDFQAAEDAFDDFQIVIGLDPINSPVSGVVYDQSSGQPIDATLTFGGSGASSLIDAYSDPLRSSVQVENGTITMGLANSVTPTEGTPFTFTVTAEAPGYYSRTRTVTATEVGSVEFEVVMVRAADGNSTIQGTSSAQSSVQTNNSGAVQQTTTVQTQADGQNNAQATATAVFPIGSVPVSANGTPISGNLQTQIRAYDPGQGASSLPQGATMTGSGSNQPVVGGVFFLMSAGPGNVVANFTGSGSGKGAGACTDAGGVFELAIAVTDAATVAAVQALGSVNAQVWGFTPADGANNQLGSTVLTTNGGVVEGIVCVGGTLGNVDLNNLGNTNEGVFFTLVLPPSVGSLAALNHSLTVSNASAAAVAGTISLQGPGVYATRNLTFPSSTTTRSLANWLGVSGDYFIVSGATYTISIQVDGGNPTTATTADPSSGSSTINLSVPSTATTYTVNASFECASGTFDVAVSESSLDGVSVFYRRLPNGQPRVIPNDDSVTKETDQSTYIRVSTQLSAIAGETYLVTGVLDNESADVEVTAPVGTTTWEISLDSDDVGVGCSVD